MSCSGLDEVKEHTKDDPELQMVMHFMRNGWPKYASKVLDNVKPYYTMKDSQHAMIYFSMATELSFPNV